MKSQIVQSKMTVAQRAEKVREAFQSSSPEEKTKIFNLAPIPKESELSLNDIFGRWDQSWEQSWPQSFVQGW